MGILDEAIREHLDLKRQHGAEGQELKRLEDEAFGTWVRPGEPDFPEAEVAVVEADVEAGTGELAAAEVEAETTVAPQSGPPSPEAPAPTEAEEPSAPESEPPPPDAPAASEPEPTAPP